MKSKAIVGLPGLPPGRRRARGMPDEAHPSHSDRVVIPGCGAVMLRESLNSLHHARERLLWWKMTGIDPSQANVLTMVEHLFGDPERFECFAEILIGPIRWMHRLRLGRGCLFQLRTFPTLSDYTISYYIGKVGIGERKRAVKFPA